MRFDNLHPADQLAATMNRIYTGGLTTASAGNLSIRDSEGDIWITPDGVDKGTLTSQDMIRITPDKSITGHWQPSSGLSFHEAIYNAKPQIQAILHAHSPSLTIFTMIHELPVLNIIPNSALQCCPIIMIPYGSGDNAERQRLLADLFHRDYRAVLIENHGVYVAADSLTKAYRIFETLEHAAWVELMARRIGEPSILTDDEVNVARTNAHTRLSDFQSRCQSSEEKALRRDLVRIIKRAVEQGIFGATHGTLSSKLSDGSFLITPYGLDRYEIVEDDLVLIRRSMKESGKTPSRAVFLHELIYHKNPDIQTVISAQPPYLSALSVNRTQLDLTALPECHCLLNPVPLIPYGQNYLQPQATAAQFSSTVSQVMLENDGVIVTGQSLSDAFDQLEGAESAARVILNLPKPAQKARKYDHVDD